MIIVFGIPKSKKFVDELYYDWKDYGDDRARLDRLLDVAHTCLRIKEKYILKRGCRYQRDHACRGNKKVDHNGFPAGNKKLLLAPGRAAKSLDIMAWKTFAEVRRLGIQARQKEMVRRVLRETGLGEYFRYLQRRGNYWQH